MRYVRFEKDGAVACGIVEGNEIAVIAGEIFEGGDRTGETHALDSVKPLPPLIPTTFYAAGLNYVAHIMEQAEARGAKPNIPEKPDIGYRANNALIGHNETIVIPKDATDLVEYEAELVVIIGKQAKHLSEADALSCVFGYTIGNDVSERTWQRGDRTFWRGKNADTFKPMGPWVETDVDLDSLRTTVRLNGEETISFETNNMLFGIERYISAMSQYLTLYPGDVIWMGTEGKSPQMKHGDVCEIDISGIGTLRNPVVRES
jgi:2-keto-4-pentenoate hydratase/2-oxohepta-3-ene-1,7-dioic acid hydratase in catechol pathway